MNFHNEIRQALKLNDPDYMIAIAEIKQRYVNQGMPIETIRSTIREIIHEDSKPAAMPEPEAPQPVRHEANQEECKRGSLQGEELSKRVRQSYEQEEGMTPSGTKKSGAASGRSILDLADNK